ncbi:MAG: hypothetical protein WAL72_34490 [Streptosporangiaceae bacterium]
MRVESFGDGDGTMVPPGSGPRVRAGRLITTIGGPGGDARSLEAPIVQVPDG